VYETRGGKPDNKRRTTDTWHADQGGLGDFQKASTPRDGAQTARVPRDARTMWSKRKVQGRLHSVAGSFAESISSMEKHLSQPEEAQLLVDEDSRLAAACVLEDGLLDEVMINITKANVKRFLSGALIAIEKSCSWFWSILCVNCKHI
jgi:hypothetical protein